jgi:hypothetical protein
MRAPEFDSKNKKWDRYGAFHTHVGDDKFVYFETGEVMAVGYRWRPHQRKYYPDLNVSVTSPRDREFKFALPDGTPCPTAWLISDNTPDLLVDHDTKRAVRLGYGRGDDVKKLPKHLQHARAFFSGNNAFPQSMAKIEIAKPYRLSKENRKWLEDFYNLCAVYTKATGFEPPNRWWTPSGMVIQHAWFNDTPSKIFTGLSDEARAGVSIRGVVAAKIQEKVDYLVVTSL